MLRIRLKQEYSKDNWLRLELIDIHVFGVLFCAILELRFLHTLLACL